MIALGEVQASLGLFAEAIAGEPVSFSVAEHRRDCWPASHRALTGHVTLPLELEYRWMYRSLLLHQLLAGPALEPAMATRNDPLFLRVTEIAEDHRVIAETQRRFPGAAADLANLIDDERRCSLRRKAPSAVDFVRGYSLGAGRSELRRSGTAHGIDAALLETMLDLLDDVLVDAATIADSRRVATHICRLLEAADTGIDMTALLADIAAEDEDAATVANENTTGITLDGGTPNEFVDNDDVGGGQLLGDLGDEVAASAEADDADTGPAGLVLPTPPSAASRARDRTFVYDEWDYHAGQHRRAWCRVTEEHLVGDDHTFIADVRIRHRALRSRIRRSLLKLRPHELVRVYRCDDGDELDLDATIEAMADRRGGAPVDDRLQIRRDRAVRDVATAFLVDLSASTSTAAVPPEPEPFPIESDPADDPMSYGPIWDTPPATEPIRRVIDVAKDAVALMGDALHDLGDRYAIYGFSGTGREGVEFKIGKDFDDRVSPAGWAAVGAMKPLRYTRMGPAVRHAAAKLAIEPARTKLLVVISDGYPQDTDYGYDRHDRDYGLHDTARALADATAAGIDTFCVTIDPAGHDYLRVMCPQDRYLVIDDVESLPEELARLYFLTLRA